MLRRSVSPALSSSIILAAAMLSAQPGAAQSIPNFNGGGIDAEQQQQQQRGSSSSGPSINIRDPADPEVMRAERGAINPPPQPTTPLEQPLNPDEYICGRGDTFELNFWGQQNFKLRVIVDLEGRTFISKVGYVEIVGKTLTEARRIVKKTVARYYPGLNFDLSLIAPRSFLVHIIGFFSKTGLISATPIERVGSVLSRTGNITGSNRRIEIRRKGGATLIADLLMYDLTGDSKYNPFVMDGDIISIPYPQTSVSIIGPVKRAGRYELIATKDLAELLQLSDGFTSVLTRQLPLRIIRRDKNQRDVEVQVPFPAGDANPNLPLNDGDQVFVPSLEELQSSILLIGPVEGATRADEVTSTRRINYFAGATVRSVVERAGNVGASADLEAAYIRHENGSITPVDLRALLVLRDFSADKPVKVADAIVIPQRRMGVIVEGAVVRPGLYPFNPRFSPAEYVGVAGGASRNARSASNYKIITMNGTTRPLRGNTRIESGDTLVIPERTFTSGEITQLVMGGVGLLLSAVSVAILVTRY